MSDHCPVENFKCSDADIDQVFVIDKSLATLVTPQVKMYSADDKENAMVLCLVHAKENVASANAQVQSRDVHRHRSVAMALMQTHSRYNGFVVPLSPQLIAACQAMTDR